MPSSSSVSPPTVGRSVPVLEGGEELCICGVVLSAGAASIETNLVLVQCCFALHVLGKKGRGKSQKERKQEIEYLQLVGVHVLREE